ncbi:MAG: hypothetical protein PVI71_11330 [Desulfobacterales bacterium]|jgi:hypothetical protein
MLWNKKEEKILEPVDIKTGIDLLQKQIEAAKRLLNKQPVTSKAHRSWNDTTHECLIRIYGERSPNLDTIIRAAGKAPVWLFMPDDVAENHAVSRLENQMQLLEGCVVTLKRKSRKSKVA